MRRSHVSVISNCCPARSWRNKNSRRNIHTYCTLQYGDVLARRAHVPIRHRDSHRKAKCTKPNDGRALSRFQKSSRQHETGYFPPSRQFSCLSHCVLPSPPHMSGWNSRHTAARIHLLAFSPGAMRIGAGTRVCGATNGGAVHGALVDALGHDVVGGDTHDVHDRYGRVQHLGKRVRDAVVVFVPSRALHVHAVNICARRGLRVNLVRKFSTSSLCECASRRAAGSARARWSANKP